MIKQITIKYYPEDKDVYVTNYNNCVHDLEPTFIEDGPALNQCKYCGEVWDDQEYKAYFND